MDSGFLEWFENLKQIASDDYGYDTNYDYFGKDSFHIWNEHFENNLSEIEAIEFELGW